MTSASTTSLTGVRRRRRAPRSWLARLLMISLGATLLTCIVVPAIAQLDLGATDLINRLKPPVFKPGGTWAHPLGTDALGRDLLLRIVYGTANAIKIAGFGMVIASIIGATLGVLAGWFGGRLDTAIEFLIDVRLSVPTILIASACAAFFGSTPLAMILIIGLSGWAGFARIVRGELLRLRELTFIEASRSIGTSRLRILAEHVVPNLAPALIVNATLQLNGFLLLETALSYLGLGIQPPNVSLGMLVNDGRQYMIDQWWLSAAPSVVIVALILQITLLGDWLRDRLDPSLRFAQ